MASALDILPGHTGICHRARAFLDPELERIARAVERDFAARFLAHDLVMRVVPIEIDFRARAAPPPRRRHKIRDHVGDGVAMRVDAVSGYRGDPPEWLADAEADMIVRRRIATASEWETVHAPDEVDALLRQQAEAYLRELDLTRGDERARASRR